MRVRTFVMAAPNAAGRSLLWALLESGGLSVLSFIALLVLARLVGPAEFGLAALAFGVVQTLSVIVESLFHDAIVQRRTLTDKHLDTALWAGIALGVAAAGGCWLLGPAIGAFLDAPNFAPVLAVMGMGLVFSGAACAPMAGLRRNLNFRPLTTASLVARLASAIIAVVMAFMGYGVWSLVGQQVALMAIKAAILWSAMPWRPRPRLSLPHLRKLLSFGGLSFGSRIVWIGSVRLFMLLVGHTLGVTAVGYMNIASRVVDTVFDLFGGAAHNLALTVFARRQTDRDALSRAFQMATQFAAMGMLPLFAGLAFCAPQTVALVLGAEWLPSVPLIQILSVASMAQFIFLFPNAAVTAIGRPGIIFAMSIFSTSLVMAVFLLVGPDNVVEATAIWASRIVITAPILVVLMHRLLHLPMTGILRAAAPPLAATLIMVGVLVPVQMEIDRVIGGPAALAALVSVGAVCYALALLVLDAGAIKRLMGFLASGLGRSSAT